MILKRIDGEPILTEDVFKKLLMITQIQILFHVFFWVWLDEWIRFPLIRRSLELIRILVRHILRKRLFKCYWLIFLDIQCVHVDLDFAFLLPLRTDNEFCSWLNDLVMNMFTHSCCPFHHITVDLLVRPVIFVAFFDMAQSSASLKLLGRWLRHVLHVESMCTQCLVIFLLKCWHLAISKLHIHTRSCYLTWSKAHDLCVVVVVLIYLIAFVYFLDFFLFDGRRRHGTSTKLIGVVNRLHESFLKQIIGIVVLTLQLIISNVLVFVYRRDLTLLILVHDFNFYYFKLIWYGWFIIFWNSN